jgi:hypothetical protein
MPHHLNALNDPCQHSLRFSAAFASLTCPGLRAIAGRRSVVIAERLYRRASPGNVRYAAGKVTLSLHGNVRRMGESGRRVLGAVR